MSSSVCYYSDHTVVLNILQLWTVHCKPREGGIAQVEPHFEWLPLVLQPDPRSLLKSDFRTFIPSLGLVCLSCGVEEVVIVVPACAETSRSSVDPLERAQLLITKQGHAVISRSRSTKWEKDTQMGKNPKGFISIRLKEEHESNIDLIKIKFNYTHTMNRRVLCEEMILQKYLIVDLAHNDTQCLIKYV